jgi:superoxide reductase
MRVGVPIFNREDEDMMNLSEIIKGEKDQGKEKHIPHIMIDRGHKEGNDIVRVVVGHESPHPNTEAHHIAWIELYGVEKHTGQLINLGRTTWAPVYSNPNVRIQINHIEEFGTFCALAYCTLHGVWGNLIEMDWIEEKREDKSVIGEALGVLLEEN